MIAQNRCRPEWRNLSPARECEIRSARTGVPEVPGRLPNGAGQDEARAARYVAILDEIRAGNNTLQGIAKALNAKWARNVLQTMAAAGMVVRIHHGSNPASYEVVK